MSRHLCFITLDIGGTTARGFAGNWSDGLVTPIFTPSINFRLANDTELMELLKNVYEQVLSAGLNPKETIWLIGAAGARPDYDIKRLARILGELDVALSEVKIFRDYEANHAAAFGGGDGILSVNGTGSVIYGRWRGKEGRKGGWGYLLEEAPSAGLLGRWAVQAILYAFEGDPVSEVWPQLIASSITTELMSGSALLEHIYREKYQQKVLGNFAPILTMACDKGCAWSRARLKKSFLIWANELVKLGNELSLPDSTPLVGLGGLWSNWPSFQHMASEALNEICPGRFTITAPLLMSGWGPLIRYLFTCSISQTFEDSSPEAALNRVIQMAKRT